MDTPPHSFLPLLRHKTKGTPHFRGFVTSINYVDCIAQVKRRRHQPEGTEEGQPANGEYGDSTMVAASQIRFLLAHDKDPTGHKTISEYLV
jgi:hypothetical protein